MSSGLLIRFLICILFFGFLLFQTIRQQNTITALRLEIPKMTHQLREIEGENSRLRFEIERFENPAHLLQLAEDPCFSHLRYPQQGEVIVLR